MTLAPREGDDDGRHWTVEDYRALDDDQRYEVLRGKLIMVPAPGTPHQRIITRLGTLLDSHITAEGLGECFHAPFDVYLSEDTVVQPDFTFVAVDRVEEVLKPHGVVGAPDLVVEVLSPSTASRDRGEKRSVYAEAGVRWLLIIDPDNQTVEVFHLSEDGRYEWMDTFADSESLEVGLFPELSIELEEVWPEQGSGE